jgi:hypothetical protein
MDFWCSRELFFRSSFLSSFFFFFSPGPVARPNTRLRLFVTHAGACVYVFVNVNVECISASEVHTYYVLCRVRREKRSNIRTHKTLMCTQRTPTKCICRF